MNDAASSTSSPFDWMEFPEGRARFAGGIRGIVDEQGHYTFAVEVGGQEYFGEIKRAFLPNGNDYNIEVVSFGYGARNYVGMEMVGTCQVFTPEEVGVIEALTVQLIEAGKHLPDPPSLLDEYPNARFMGEVIFRDGWVLARAGEVA